MQAEVAHASKRAAARPVAIGLKAGTLFVGIKILSRRKRREAAGGERLPSIHRRLDWRRRRRRGRRRRGRGARPGARREGERQSVSLRERKNRMRKCSPE